MADCAPDLLVSTGHYLGRLYYVENCNTNLPALGGELCVVKYRIPRSLMSLNKLTMVSLGRNQPSKATPSVILLVLKGA